MCERIKEILKEHGFIHEFMSVGELNDALRKYEELVKLIVRECAQVASDCDGTHYVGTAIEQHFGVEE